MSTQEREESPDTLRSAADLDEDRLGVDPMADGVEPPEHWSGADQHGTTANEQREGETLEERLEEEVPDTEPDPVPERPRAATPDVELDESVDADPPLGDEDPATQRELEEGPERVERW